MISAQCDFDEFIRVIETQPYEDAFWLLEKEATCAERCAHKSALSEPHRSRCSRDYAGTLKSLIAFLRYRTYHLKVDDQKREAFAALARKWGIGPN